MITVLYGKDEFSANEELLAMQAEVNGDAPLGDSTVRVDGASARPDELLAVCQTMPFMGTRRLVIVRGLLGRFESAGRRRPRKQDGGLGPWAPFVEGLQALPESTTLVFLDGELRPQNPFLQAIRPLAELRECKPLRQAELAVWITRRAERYEVSLEARAVAALAGLVGNQLWTLDSELQKLAAYASGRQVTDDDVRSLVSLAREPNIYAMVDAVIEGRSQEAAKLFQRLLADGESPMRLLNLLGRQYRLLLLTKELVGKRVRPPEISARLRVQGFVIQRILRQAPAYTIDRLRQAYRRILDADLSIKRGVHDEETALQLLLFELSALARRSPARVTSQAGR